ncbi:MAG: hypothetical protein JO165_05715 [Candidatus Eremiobacteraeota bacterium]|nr:hypothetical protein [Candidatus Eremiobacteraeota bacterium]
MAQQSYGGVSGRAHGRSLQGARVVVQAAPSTSGAFPNFVNHGGPVVSTPVVRATFWGASWSTAAAQTTMQRLFQYCTDILNSPFMNVIAQYGVGSARFAGSTIMGNVSGSLTNAQIDSQIQSGIDAGTLTEPPKNNTSDCLVIFLDESVEVNDSAQGLVMCEPSGDTAFGYHDFFTTKAGNDLYYAVIPALDDKCIQQTCPGGDSGCSLSIGATQEQRRTQVTSHELAEMFTDPQLNAWYDPQNGENGDICNGETGTITVAGNTWSVQRIYSKHDDEQSDGGTYCVSEAPNPIPAP